MSRNKVCIEIYRKFVSLMPVSRCYGRLAGRWNMAEFILNKLILQYLKPGAANIIPCIVIMYKYSNTVLNTSQ